MNIDNYKEYLEKYSSIEIEIKPMENEYGRFIKIKEKMKNIIIYIIMIIKKKKLKVLH